MKVWRSIICIFALFIFTQNAYAQVVQDECADITDLHRVPNFDEEISRVRDASVFIWVTVSVMVGDRLDPNRQPLPQINFVNQGKGILILDGDDSYILTVGHLFNADPADIADALEGHPAYGDLADVNRIDLRGNKFSVAVGIESDSLASVLTTVETIQWTYDFGIGDTAQRDGFALLRVPKPFSDIQGVEVMSSSCLSRDNGIGTVVWEVGGDVRADRMITTVDVHRHEVSNIGNANIFRVSTPIWPGASGSGVVGYHLGKAKLMLLGIVAGHEGASIPGFGLLPIRGIIYKSDPVVEYLRNN